MAKVCYFTGRKTVSGNNRSHAMNQTKRAVKPNLQKVTVLIDGKPKKVWASARALKSGKVERRLILLDIKRDDFSRLFFVHRLSLLAILML